MPRETATLADMVKEMSKRKPRMGRPPKRPADRLTPARFVRLSRTLDAAVEVHRKALEQSTGLPVDLSDAMRDLIEKGARAENLLPPPPPGAAA